jgi:hypothetical protein
MAVTTTSAFSQRILTNPCVSTYPPLPSPLDWTLEVRYAVAIRNQLLVHAELAKLPAFLKQFDPYKPRLVTTLFNGITTSVDDVAMYELTDMGGLSIFEVANNLQDRFGPASWISPNHVLVPANESDFCPSGPPSPTATPSWYPQVPFPAPPPSGAIPVALIDAGYQWNPAWPHDPLTNVLVIQQAELPPNGPLPTGEAGDWLGGTPDVTPAQWAAAPVGQSPETVTLPGTGQRALVGLAGHANFVAGLIAFVCPEAQITLYNFDAAYEAGQCTTLPTEFAITRAIVRAAADGAKVIHVSFAASLSGAAPSQAWSSALQQIGPEVAVVAPAGNEHSQAPRYPAALHSTYSQVIGVASTTQAAVPVGWVGNWDWANAYSNSGPWVACAADGSMIMSTFLYVDQALEEGDGQPHDFTANGMALWNGTCFAAAKVTGNICKFLVTDPTGWGRAQNPMYLSGQGAGTFLAQWDPKGMLGWIQTY